MADHQCAGDQLPHDNNTSILEWWLEVRTQRRLEGTDYDSAISTIRRNCSTD
ncbi:predicted protein [Uncinocarpus reesii 1704]|uniref:Uncharacterized protein n=1 Tax=Uncinocarpus reesii (strain UAMH 1704) TaxID=336963 RepID=C4JGD3_UNCRE|nr:uncharacterized protein UREG_01124 [Uncinocarpus reesii 1704]EEP76275.1 predicted protein [Uncinocarpus reesii 1704]